MDNSSLDDTDINLIERKKAHSKVPVGTVTRNFFEIERLGKPDIGRAMQKIHGGGRICVTRYENDFLEHLRFVFSNFTIKSLPVLGRHFKVA